MKKSTSMKGKGKRNKEEDIKKGKLREEVEGIVEKAIKSPHPTEKELPEKIEELINKIPENEIPENVGEVVRTTSKVIDKMMPSGDEEGTKDKTFMNLAGLAIENDNIPEKDIEPILKQVEDDEQKAKFVVAKVDKVSPTIAYKIANTITDNEKKVLTKLKLLYKDKKTYGDLEYVSKIEQIISDVEKTEDIDNEINKLIARHLAKCILHKGGYKTLTLERLMLPEVMLKDRIPDMVEKEYSDLTKHRKKWEGKQELTDILLEDVVRNMVTQWEKENEKGKSEEGEIVINLIKPSEIEELSEDEKTKFDKFVKKYEKILEKKRINTDQVRKESEEVQPQPVTLNLVSTDEQQVSSNLSDKINNLSPDIQKKLGILTEEDLIKIADFPKECWEIVWSLSNAKDGNIFENLEKAFEKLSPETATNVLNSIGTVVNNYAKRLQERGEKNKKQNTEIEQNKKNPKGESIEL